MNTKDKNWSVWMFCFEPTARLERLCFVTPTAHESETAVFTFAVVRAMYFTPPPLNCTILSVRPPRALARNVSLINKQNLCFMQFFTVTARCTCTPVTNESYLKLEIKSDVACKDISCACGLHFCTMYSLTNQNNFRLKSRHV